MEENYNYLLVEWLNDSPIIDGSVYFDTKEECLEYCKSLPNVENLGINIKYTICRITKKTN